MTEFIAVISNFFQLNLTELVMSHNYIFGEMVFYNFLSNSILGYPDFFL
jgi:hypothetical protein